MDHSVHHLTDAEAVTEVMEGVVSVIFLDCQLELIIIYSVTVLHMLSVRICMINAEERVSDLTSHLFRVMGFMLNSFTRPRS